MTYNLLILRGAQKELSELPAAAYERVKIAIRKLADDPRPHGNRKLSGRDGYRIRVGAYRVIYEIDNRFSYWPQARCLQIAAKVQNIANKRLDLDLYLTTSPIDHTFHITVETDDYPTMARALGPLNTYGTGHTSPVLTLDQALPMVEAGAFRAAK